MMDKKVEEPKLLLNAVVFGDDEVDTSATDDVMMVTDRYYSYNRHDSY